MSFNLKDTVLILIYIFLTLSTAARDKDKNRYTIVLEKVEYFNYDPSVLSYNVTVHENSSFSCFVHLLKPLEPIMGIRLTLIRNGKKADLVNQKLDYCSLEKIPNPVGAIFIDMLKKGSNFSMTCPLKPGYASLRAARIPAYRLPTVLPELPFEMVLDISKKQGGKRVTKTDLYGKIKHV